ncbi:MAG: cytidylyltransferase domain-containing protein [Candidatus Methylomirabilales bacterium]
MKEGAVIVGAICARGGSKGVRRKNLIPLGGIPLIVHTIRCAQACPVLHRIVVSTDDEEIAEVAKKHGAEVPFIRPAHLAQDDSPKWQVFQHLVQTMEQMTGRAVDVLVDLDAGVPLRQPSDIVRCVDQLLSGQAEVVVTAYKAERNPYFNMIELNADGFAKIVKESAKPITRRQDAPPVYNLSPAVYAILRDALWKHEHWSEARVQIQVIPRERAIDIDSEFDFFLVEHLMRLQELR